MAEEPNIRTEEPAPHIEDSDFWEIYKGRIIGGFALVILAILAFGAYQITDQLQISRSEQALATAATAEEYLSVAEEYAGTVPAGNALLLAGNLLAKEEELEQATVVLREFVDRYSTHELVPGGYLKLAAVLAEQGETGEATALLQQVVHRFPASYAAPVGLATQAEIFRSTGELEQAARALETLINQYPASAFSEQAVQSLRSLRALQPETADVVMEIAVAEEPAEEEVDAMEVETVEEPMEVVPEEPTDAANETPLEEPVETPALEETSESDATSEAEDEEIVVEEN